MIVSILPIALTTIKRRVADPAAWTAASAEPVALPFHGQGI
jgi:hypothetical protein